jgi:hypothetical protein
MVDTPAPEKMNAADENVAMTIGQSAYAFPEQDHLGHIQAHLDYAKNPVFGGNPMVAPSFLPKAMEHIKQHISLWYLNRMNGYVQQALGRKIEDYSDMEDPKDVDKLFGAASQHVDMDAEQTLAGIMPVIQKMVQTMEQFKPKPQLTPDGQVLLQTSMAETQRRTQRDQAEMGLKDKELAARLQLDVQKLQADQQHAMEELQLKLAIATGDQELKERIETARLTRDAAKLKQDGEKAVLDLTTKQGGQYGYE